MTTNMKDLRNPRAKQKTSSTVNGGHGQVAPNSESGLKGNEPEPSPCSHMPQSSQTHINLRMKAHLKKKKCTYAFLHTKRYHLP